MRNLLVLAIALKVAINDTDAKHLTHDVSEADFRNYFEIPETTKIDMENMTSDYEGSADFDIKSLEKYMNAKEKKTAKEKFPEAFKDAETKKEPKTKTAEAKKTPEQVAAENKAKKEEAAKVKADEKAKKAAEKEAAKKAKEAAKIEADKKKEEEKAAKLAEKEAAKAAKQAEKDAKASAKKSPKPLSRSQEIQIYHNDGKDFQAVKELHPDWNEAHIRNALYYAKNNPEVVAKTVLHKAEIEKWNSEQEKQTETETEANA